jgi:hypothetical protein
LQEIPQQGTVRGQRVVGKTSSHYIAYYIAFFQQSLNYDCLHHVYMQDFYRVEPGFEQQAMRVAEMACRKLVKDMHYEACV